MQQSFSLQLRNKVMHRHSHINKYALGLVFLLSRYTPGEFGWREEGWYRFLRHERNAGYRRQIPMNFPITVLAFLFLPSLPDCSAGCSAPLVGWPSPWRRGWRQLHDFQVMTCSSFPSSTKSRRRH